VSTTLPKRTPWRYERGPKSIAGKVLDSEGRTVCQPIHVNTDSANECIAIGHLLAAAPDLLEACKKAAHLLMGAGDHPGREFEAEACRALTAAISKATSGNQPPAPTAPAEAPRIIPGTPCDGCGAPYKAGYEVAFQERYFDRALWRCGSCGPNRTGGVA
jgi:hypothetical protein